MLARYAEKSKTHGYAITGMSTRFSHATFVPPDFEVNAKGEIPVESLPTFEPTERSIEPKEKTLGFFRTFILPSIGNQNRKRLAKQYLLRFNGSTWLRDTIDMRGSVNVEDSGEIIGRVLKFLIEPEHNDVRGIG